MYQLIDANGNLSEPLDVPALQTMATDRRLHPQQMVFDPISGLRQPAEQMLSHQIAFPPIVGSTSLGTTTYAPQVDTSLLGSRFGGYIIDVVCSVPLLIPALIPLVGILFAPLLVLYWLSRDAFFGGQSVGKKVLGLKVVRLDGGPVDWVTSAKRNIVFAPLLLAAIPFLGIPIGGGLLSLINIAEIVLVLTTGKRIGDNIANTVVVRA